MCNFKFNLSNIRYVHKIKLATSLKSCSQQLRRHDRIGQPYNSVFKFFSKYLTTVAQDLYSKS